MPRKSELFPRVSESSAAAILSHFDGGGGGSEAVGAGSAAKLATASNELVPIHRKLISRG
jgi:hypothetical protein